MARQQARTGGTQRKRWYATLNDCLKADQEKRGELPDLSEGQILAWADSYYARLDRWPGTHAGPIPEAPGETWLSVEAALTLGLRGLHGHTTLALLLKEQRGRYHLKDPHQFTVRQFWPGRTLGTVAKADGRPPHARQAFRKPAVRTGGSSTTSYAKAGAGCRADHPYPNFWRPSAACATIWACLTSPNRKSWPGRMPIANAPASGRRRCPARLRTLRAKHGLSSITLFLMDYAVCQGAHRCRDYWQDAVAKATTSICRPIVKRHCSPGPKPIIGEPGGGRMSGRAKSRRRRANPGRRWDQHFMKDYAGCREGRRYRSSWPSIWESAI